LTVPAVPLQRAVAGAAMDAVKVGAGKIVKATLLTQAVASVT
jgi:hypothetical protein